MKTWQPAVPRKLAGVAAIAMTALTIGMLVVAPTQSERSDQGAMISASAATSEAGGATEVTIVPATIHIVAVRERSAFERLRALVDHRRQAA